MRGEATSWTERLSPSCFTSWSHWRLPLADTGKKRSLHGLVFAPLRSAGARSLERQPRRVKPAGEASLEPEACASRAPGAAAASLCGASDDPLRWARSNAGSSGLAPFAEGQSGPISLRIEEPNMALRQRTGIDLAL